MLLLSHVILFSLFTKWKEDFLGFYIIILFFVLNSNLLITFFKYICKFQRAQLPPSLRPWQRNEYSVTKMQFGVGQY